jgi:hypothetical protein
VVHARDETSARQAVAALRAATAVGDTPPRIPEPVLEVLR